MSGRDPEQVAGEVDYWRELLQVALTANGAVATAADQLVNVPLDLLVLALIDPSPIAQQAHEDAVAHAAAALEAVKVIGDAIGDIVNLIGGRSVQLRGEVDELKGGQ